MFYNIFRFFGLLLMLLSIAFHPLHSQQLSGFDTNTDKRSIDLDDLKAGGPGKDGIPSIDDPKFVSQADAAEWLASNEPVISLEVNGEARAYPLQILIWHEIANDELGGVPVAVTFCPLCYSAIVFDRRVDGETLRFGVSGFLRHSDMIMYDRKTESLWQQFSGEALVGDYTGTELTIIPSQLISFEQFRNSFPDSRVLSRNTGYNRNYGENPYAGYDDINNSPFLLDEDELTDKLPPMEKVIGVRSGEASRAYPYSETSEERVIQDVINGEPIVIFHVEGMASAMDNRRIQQSRDDGATGVFSPVVKGDTLEFKWENDAIKDTKTESKWSISGKAVKGPLKGEQLETKTYGDYFAFAWMVFYPNTEIYR
ncbi:DUF3179 domain-containing protein [Rhodohalobacter sp. 8-1]|uniref:DUF3179 domain-containing protein n=1 Tax=Rhodohalobacter sp. 8-1 TaxID=3131972 RepID=UPI0030EB961A